MIQPQEQFDYLKIKIASPIQILKWATRLLPNGQYIGEVFIPETVNYRTYKPEMGGLFCQRIFGPIDNFKCACGKYKEVQYEGLICDRCGVELTDCRVRRHRMGYSKLIYPVTHIWYLESRPNFLALLLEVEQCENRVDTGLRYRLMPQNILYQVILEKIFYAYKSSTLPKNVWFEIIRDIYRKQSSAMNDHIKFYIKKFRDVKKLLVPKLISAKHINTLDQRIKRIKLASLIYFLSDTELEYHCMHWDLQKYRRAREIGFTMYCEKPYPNIEANLSSFDIYRYYKYELPKYLSTATPLFLFGARLVKRELERLNLPKEVIRTRRFITLCTKILMHELPYYTMSQWCRNWERKRIHKLLIKAIQRLRMMENLIATGASPNWMILKFLPIIPPALRPMVMLESGRFATSDLNELYRKVISRNNRLIRLFEIESPSLVIRNEKRLLQEAVDTLIDNGRRGKIIVNANERPLKSLSSIIKGKQGRFRKNLLGKRVDYSGRSVIVVGPDLKLNQCGLPIEMAFELFEPFIISKLINNGFAFNIKMARDIIDTREPIVEIILHEVLVGHPIFLNRAPTLHRLGVQAFEPILIKERAIKLHPLVCSAFNADFDGDQMAIHIPLSTEARMECYFLMLAPYNFLSPANGEPTIVPSQDMVLGCYYLTLTNIQGLPGANHYFADLEDVLLAYYQEQMDLHTSIWVRYPYEINLEKQLLKRHKLNDNSSIEFYENLQVRRDIDGTIIVKYLQTTPGRILFNYTIQKTLHLI